MTPEAQLEMLLREVGQKPTAQDLAEVAALRKVHGLGDSERIWTTLISATFDRSLLRADLARNANLVTKSVGQATGALEPAVKAAVLQAAAGAIAQHRSRSNVATAVAGACVAAAIFLFGAWYGTGLQTASSSGSVVRFSDLANLLGGPVFFTAMILGLTLWSVQSFATGMATKVTYGTSALAVILTLGFGFYAYAPYIPGSFARIEAHYYPNESCNLAR